MLQCNTIQTTESVFIEDGSSVPARAVVPIQLCTVSVN